MNTEDTCVVIFNTSDTGVPIRRAFEMQGFRNIIELTVLKEKNTREVLVHTVLGNGLSFQNYMGFSAQIAYERALEYTALDWLVDSKLIVVDGVGMDLGKKKEVRSLIRSEYYAIGGISCEVVGGVKMDVYNIGVEESKVRAFKKELREQFILGDCVHVLGNLRISRHLPPQYM